MSNMLPEFEKIDAILKGKGQSILTEQEKVIIEQSWKHAYMKFQMMPNNATSDFAIHTQLVGIFSNIIFDVLLHTRKK